MLRRMKPVAYLNRPTPLPFGTIYPQSVMDGWIAAATRRLPGPRERERNSAAALLERLEQAGVIKARRSALPDFGAIDDENRVLFRDDPATGAPWYRPTLEARMTAFARTSREIALTAFPADEAP